MAISGLSIAAAICRRRQSRRAAPKSQAPPEKSQERYQTSRLLHQLSVKITPIAPRSQAVSAKIAELFCGWLPVEGERFIKRQDVKDGGRAQRQLGFLGLLAQ